MPWRTALTAALALASATMLTMAPALSASDACEAEALASSPLLTLGAFTGECAGAFVALHHDACMMVEWGVHAAPVGVGGANTCVIGVWVSGDAPSGPPVLP